ncbi:hypothetical protein KC352_g10062, partial [Hortaea werneckii]
AAEEAAREAGKLREDFQKQSAERDAAADAHLAALRESHSAELAKASEAHAVEIETSRRDVEAAKTELSSARADHERLLSELRESSGSDVEKLKASHATELEGVKKLHQSVMGQMETAQSNHRGQVAELKAAHERSMSDLVAQHGRAIDAQKSALQETSAGHAVEIDSLRQSHGAALRELEGKLSGELSDAQLKHQSEMEGLRSNLASELETAKGAHEKALADRDAHWSQVIAGLKDEHTHAHAEALKNSDASSAEKLQELERKHAEALDKAMESARSDAERDTSAASKQHQEALENATAEASRKSQADLDQLKLSHSEAIARVRQEVETESQARLREVQQHHETSLESFIAEVRAQSETNRDIPTNTQDDEVSKLQQRVLEADKRADEARSQHESMAAEIVALQGRLDAELTSHAEAERSLSEIRKQNFDGEKRLSGSREALSREALLRQVAHQQEQLERLGKENVRVDAEPLGSDGLPNDVDMLKQRLGAAEREGQTIEQVIREKNELSRQNEFLVKKLEARMAQMGSSPDSKKTDAEVQTESVISVPATPRTPNQSFAARFPRAERNGPQEQESSTEHQSNGLNGDQQDGPTEEQKADLHSLRSVKGKKIATDRPTSPSSPSKKISERRAIRHVKTDSFEDYLKRAQTELSDLGATIVANESLFHEKIQEHVGELQRAKDQLAADYKERFDALFAEKEKREKDATSHSAAEFAKERSKLVAKYGVEEKDASAQTAMLTSLPLDQAKELRSAEERLVAEHSRRVASRKSQIALRHAEDFQSLTQDYDRKIAELLSDRSKLENDLSVEPSRFEKDMDDLEARSGQLEAEKAGSVYSTPLSKSNSVNHGTQPQTPSPEIKRAEAVPVQGSSSSKRMSGRMLTSTPRTPASIPRAVPFPGNRDSPQATSQPSVPRTPTDTRRSTSDRYPPATQQSPMRPRSPPDGPVQRRVVTAPRTSEKWATPESKRASLAQDFGVAPEKFEQKQAPKKPTPQEAAAVEAMNKPLERAKTESPRQPRKASPSPARIPKSTDSTERQSKRSSRNFSSSSIYKKLFKHDK